MSTVETEVREFRHLAELLTGETAVCFVLLAHRETKLNKYNKPFYDCHFRASKALRVARVWGDHTCAGFVKDCPVGVAYRITVTGEELKYGSDLKLVEITLAGPDHEGEGFDLASLMPPTEVDVEGHRDSLRAIVDAFEDDYLKTLIRSILKTNRDLFIKMPAAQDFHHAYQAGLLEHVWSVTKVCVLLADHYGAYYRDLNPPLNKDLILAAAIVHDIGKLIEFNYNGLEVEYSIAGNLLGHIVLGRDMVRDAARRIDGFPEETLMLLEHAILAHHGKGEWGSPVAPKTLEAMLLHFADEIDAKMNAGARAIMTSQTDSAFTDKVWPLDNRRLYKGIPIERPTVDGSLV